MMLLEHTSVSFHIEAKKALLVIVPFSLISVLLCLFASLSLNASFAELKTLLLSDYLYSATSLELLGKDDYYKFNAAISFTLSADTGKSLNADILMQTDYSAYTDAVFWNADKLSTSGIAISKVLAVSYGLSIGDSLYSNHTVNGEVYEYLIEQILPEVSSSRIAQNNFYDGIIIMGYDDRYTDNLSHVVIVYMSDPIETLPPRQAAMLENIRYRDDEIISVCKELVPYAVVFMFLAVLNSAGFIFFLMKGIRYNFRRLIMLGYPKKNLSNAYYGLIYACGCSLILMSALIAALVLHLIGSLQISVIAFLSVPVIEFLSLQVAAVFSQNQLWRK